MTGGFSHIALSPLAALKQAVAKVPQLKYALAVIGVASVVAIVLTWIADPRIALFGIVITIALMYLLAIFAQSVGTIRKLQRLTAFLAWSVAILFVSVLVMLITSYAWGMPGTLSDRLFPSKPHETAKQRALGPGESPPQSEDELRGEVRDRQGRGIPSVNIVVVGGNEKTKSDRNGEFKLQVSQTTDGHVRLKASKDGFDTREDYFQIGDMAIIQLNKAGK